MALITGGWSPTFNIPGVDTIRDVHGGVFDACLLMEKSFANIANLQFAGSNKPNIYFGTASYPNYWAAAYLYSPGRGRIYYSNHPNVAAAWQKWGLPPYGKTLRELAFRIAYHEIGHVLANSTNQDIAYPPPAWFVRVLQKIYGQPVVRSWDASQPWTSASFTSRMFHRLHIGNRVIYKLPEGD